MEIKENQITATNLLKDIFIYNNINNNIIYKPILSLNSNSLGNKLKNIFSYPDTNIKSNINLFKSFINDKIELINKMKEIIGNSYEILQIIINYLTKNKINPIFYFIDLYFDFLSINSMKNLSDDNKELLIKLKNILIYFFSCGFMNKKYSDYIYHKLSKIQFEQKLTPELFDYYLSLIEILYGKDYDNSFKNNLIAKNYIYFYDKENSIIKTNISKNNNIYIKDACSIIMWFYIKDDMAKGCKLCQITIEKDKSQIYTTFDIILNDNFDIDVKVDIKGNTILLKEEVNKIFKLKKNKWIQLKIQVMKYGIKLNVFQDFEKFDINNLNSNSNELGSNKIKYETKLFQTNNKKSSNNNDLHFDLNNFNIIDLNFFINYIGLASTIIFCKNNNPSEIPINSLYGLKSNKISNFFGEIGLSELFFIFSPSLYNEEKNKFIYADNNITGELSLSNSFKEPMEVIDYNYVYKYSNHINNIYKIGGAINILPLFEIFYKFSKCEDNYNSILNNIFLKLVKLLELIIVNKNKNYLDIYFNNNNIFFESLQLFLENIQEKYYQNNDDILLILIDIGKYVFEYCKQKTSSENSYLNSYHSNDNLYNYFRYILFYPKIVLKFSLVQQNKIWNFFEEIKNLYKKKLKDKNSEKYIFNHSYYKKCFLSFEQLNNFILLFSEKYPNEFLAPSLVNIIKNIFLDSATNDHERESMILLINNFNNNNDNQNIYRVSDKIIISIIEIFIYYLDNNYKKFISNNTKLTDFIDNNYNSFYSPLMSIKSFLSSPNYFIETLLNILSTNNLNLKKALINLLRIISQNYSESLKDYFNKIETDIKKSKKSKKLQKVSIDEYYYFIKENISPNFNNQKFRELRKFEFDENDLFINNNGNKFNITLMRRKSSMDSINIIKNNIEKKKYKIESKKSEIIKDKKIKKIRSKSNEEKDIEEIRIKFYNINDNIYNKKRSNEFCFIDSRISIPDNFNNRISQVYTSNEIIEKINKSSENNISIKEKENIINENIVNDNKNELENQKINCEISMLLFDWLLTSEKKVINKKLSGNLSSLSNTIYDMNINSNLTDIIIDFILKLLCSNKDLEVIYKFLFIILGQKGFDYSDNKSKKIKGLQSLSDNYLKLLNFFSLSKTGFVQFLEELMINSYLCIYYSEAQNKFNFIEDSSNSHGENKKKNEYFKIIYEKTKELIIDIYFNEKNLNKSNDILYDIINIILSLYNGLKDKNELDENNIKIRDILFNFLKEFLDEISQLYNLKLDFYKRKITKKPSTSNINTKNNDNTTFINEKNDNIYSEIKKNYAIFITFIFEYSLLLINSNNYIGKKFTNDMCIIKNYSGIPEFLKYEIDKNGNKKLMSIKIDLYLKIYEDVLNFFNVEKLLKKINFQQENKNKIEINEGTVFYFEPTDINKLLKEISINKDLKNKLKEKLNLLFLSYKDEFKNFPLITIITILNNYYINYYISSKSNENVNLESSESLDFISFLNYHMQFILMVILISCDIKENDNYPLKEKSYKEIQETIFANLLYNMNNIINHYDSHFISSFVEIFTNIMTLISCICSTDNEHKSLFHLGKNKSKNGVKRTLNYYISTSFFTNSNLENFPKNKISENKVIIIEEMNNIFNKIFRNKEEFKTENLPGEDIFDINKYEHIYNSRKHKVNHKLKLLINDNLDKYNIDDIDEENEKESYKKILYKVDTLKVLYDNNDLYNDCSQILKRKNYRKIKKSLYSWNNSYSIFEAFYKEKDLIHKKEDIILKYKLSNYLSKDMTRKLLVPILDIDYYMPSFKIFKFKDKMFQNNENSNINQYQNIYKIDLKIFDDSKNILKFEEEKKYLIENVCYIKTTHHIRGKIFFQKDTNDNNINNSVSLSPPIFSIYFIESNTYEDDYLLKNCEDYDSEHLTCFGSIFTNNKNSKDSEIFLNFNFNCIHFIFLRKYCYRNNSLEIYLSNNRSYYFKFFDSKKRDKFLNELILLLNKNNPKNKLFKPIKGFDENNRTITIGYYKDEKNLKEYNSISNIRDLWKSNKISTLEFLMWVNIYGNRSFRDIAQYPVFPWLLTNYEYNTYEELVKNPEIRDFNLPMGMLYIDDKSKKRQEGYIDTYKNMVMDLYEENLINIKIKDEEEPIEQNDINNNKIIRNSVANTNTNLNIINQGPNPIQKEERNESVLINYQMMPALIEQQNQDKFLPKIPDYKFDIDKLYNNLNFEYEKIPYCFGSHYSNAMYVSHYLVRIFPYSLTMIEIQGDGFDNSDRLFLRLQNSFYTAVSEKCDLREIIPEFFTLPEMFLNINNLELGKIDINNYIKKNENTITTNNAEKKMITLNEVMMPNWCKNNPYIFTEKYRKIIESPLININPWIDLIFGYTQRGVKAQKIGNLFLPCMYDGVMNIRINKEDLLNNREENEYKMKLFEMGVNPNKVFDKKNKIIKNKPANQIIDIGTVNPEILLPEIKLKYKNNTLKKIIYMNCCSSSDDELFILDITFNGQKLNIQESKESEKNFILKETINYREFPIKNIINKNIQNKLIIKSIFKNTFFIITGFFDGSLYMIKTPNKVSKKEESQKTEDKPYLINEENIIKIFDKSLITSLEIDKEEKYLIYGTLNGSIIIYSLNYNLYKENKYFLTFKKIFKSHNCQISSISINNDLNLFADCSYDGYINIYALSSYSNFEIINSIYIDSSIYNFTLDYVFLSAQPLACVVLYSNDKCQFKSFNINGRNLQSTETDTLLTSNKFNEYYLDYDTNMTSPIIFTDYKFNDYLIYIFKKNYVLIREFPSMKIVMALNPTRDNRNEELSILSLSNDHKYLYIMEEKSNKIYIVNQKTFMNNNSNKENKKSL